MSRKYVQVIPIIEVELCPECGSDYTRYVESSLVGGEGNNKCVACEHEWDSDFKSGGDVRFVHPKMFGEQMKDDEGSVQ